ncbi:hypothetical protein KIPB_003126 [Kipferlia bialata]|uniref:Uncharacterized protein n=1 Tax=Kipferlia bialata TaxID=797122 RepID=A0A9K3CSG4_9EUKA|nr:hypothetical protein KIPB_003126 [Kipferlia bialata]|eukprot:g3126.t1
MAVDGYVYGREQLENVVKLLLPGRTPNYKMSEEERVLFIRAYFYLGIEHDDSKATSQGTDVPSWTFPQGTVIPLPLLQFFDNVPVDFHSGPLRVKDFNALYPLFDVINREADRVEDHNAGRGMMASTQLDPMNQTQPWHSDRYIFYSTTHDHTMSLDRIALVRIGYALVEPHFNRLAATGKNYMKWCACIHPPTYWYVTPISLCIS